MQRITVIALNTFKEIARKKLFYILILCGTLFLVNVKFLSVASPGTEQKLTIDIGLTTIIFFGVLLVLLTATHAIPSEIDSKTIYNILTYPVKRYEFILGKALGTTMVVLVAHTAWGCLFLLSFWLRFHTISPPLFLILPMAFLQLLLLVSISVMGSTFLTTIINIIFSVFLYFMGHFISYLDFLADKTEQLFLKNFIKCCAVLLPNFEGFTEKIVNHFLYHQHIESTEAWSITGHNLLYSGVMVMLALIIFRRKEV